MNNNNDDKNVFEAIASDRVLRQQLGQRSHHMFFVMYFPHYIKYPMAEFHKDIFRVTEDESTNLACIVAFRGSGKSTLVTFSYSLWSILGAQEKKFVLIICQTQAQARQHMANLKFELEQNTLLKSDMGPFREEAGDGQWAISSLVFKNTGARIMIASIDQSIRGIRHHEYRPDLIILDDIEDINSTKTLEGRNKIFDWFTREVVPLGDIGTRIVIVGNLLHEDSLMMRLKRKILEKDLRGVYLWFPLLNEQGDCLWPGKFDTKEKIDELRHSVANEIAWQQEYLLNIVSDNTRVVFPEWIKYYDELPKDTELRDVHIGVDLAISLRDGADYTAMVGIKRYGHGNDMRLHVIPNPFNGRVSFPEAVRTMRELDITFKTNGTRPKFIVESNGFQEIYVQAVNDAGCNVEGVKHTGDKRSRLALTGELIQNGTILFPRHGAEELVSQLTGFGIENHDDLADAFSMAVIDFVEGLDEDRGWDTWQKWVESNGGSCWV